MSGGALPKGRPVDRMSFDYDRAFNRNLGVLTEHEQAVLKTRQVAIPGCGGVGSLHALTMARLGVKKFKLADFDSYDVENMNRQFGSKMSSLGREKVRVMAEEILEINPEASVSLFPEGVHSGNLDDFLDGTHLVIDALDFFAFPARDLLFPAAQQRGIPLVTGAPLGFSCALLTFTGDSMRYEDYFDFRPEDSERDRAVKFAVGLAPGATHIKYMDFSRVRVGSQAGPSSVVGVDQCAAMVGAEATKILTGKAPVERVPTYRQYDPFREVQKSGRLRWGNRGLLQRFKIWYVSRMLSGRDEAVSHNTARPGEEHDSVQLTTVSSHCQEIREILHTALQAPSGDNCQPFQFRWDGETLRIYHDNHRGKHALNSLNQASRLTLGMLLESIKIAASEKGYRAECEELPEDEEGPWAVISVQRDDIVPDTLAPLQGMRWTDRRTYQGGSIRHWVFEDLQSEIAKFPTVGCYVIDRYPDTFVDLLARKESELFDRPEALRDLGRWLRFGSGPLADGMPWRTLGCRYPEARLLWACTRYPRITAFAKWLGLSTVHKRLVMSQLRSSAAFCLVTVPQPRVADVVAAGQLIYRLWLRLNGAAYGVHPYSSLPLSILDRHVLLAQGSGESTGQPLLHEEESVLRTAFGYREHEIPVWGFRTGSSTVRPPEFRTPRRPVVEVLKFDC